MLLPSAKLAICGYRPKPTPMYPKGQKPLSNYCPKGLRSYPLIFFIYTKPFNLGSLCLNSAQ